MLAAALMSVLLIEALASMPTLGLMSSVVPELPVVELLPPVTDPVDAVLVSVPVLALALVLGLVSATAELLLVPAVPLTPALVEVSAAMLPVVLVELSAATLPVVLIELSVVVVVPVPAEGASASGMQSTCTGLLERSFAMPVSLSASLPAFG
jgi:hypothetical protein